MIRKPTTVVCPHCDKLRVVHLLDPTALRLDAHGYGTRALACSDCFTFDETWMVRNSSTVKLPARIPSASPT